MGLGISKGFQPSGGPQGKLKGPEVIRPNESPTPGKPTGPPIHPHMNHHPMGLGGTVSDTSRISQASTIEAIRQFLSPSMHSTYRGTRTNGVGAKGWVQIMEQTSPSRFPWTIPHTLGGSLGRKKDRIMWDLSWVFKLYIFVYNRIFLIYIDTAQWLLHTDTTVKKINIPVISHCQCPFWGQGIAKEPTIHLRDFIRPDQTFKWVKKIGKLLNLLQIVTRDVKERLVQTWMTAKGRKICWMHHLCKDLKTQWSS